MAFAVELFFDHTSSAQIIDTWSDLSIQETGSYLIESRSQPHITLAVFDIVDVNQINSYLKLVSKEIDVFSLYLSSLGTFLTEEGTVFLAPVVTEKLLSIHKKIHDITRDSECPLIDLWI
ncbi:MAG: 2-5 ligase family protein [Paenibacillus sp.]|jgi:2'-5' RNA ligase|nr:2-5 ligase family protein [Paenibacillus sp.]